MLEQALLREQLQALLTKEQQAMEAYSALAARIDDPYLRGQIEQIRREKERHVQLTERLIEIVD